MRPYHTAPGIRKRKYGREAVLCLGALDLTCPKRRGKNADTEVEKGKKKKKGDTRGLLEVARRMYEAIPYGPRHSQAQIWNGSCTVLRGLGFDKVDFHFFFKLGVLCTCCSD